MHQATAQRHRPLLEDFITTIYPPAASAGRLLVAWKNTIADSAGIASFYIAYQSVSISKPVLIMAKTNMVARLRATQRTQN